MKTGALCSNSDCACTGLYWEGVEAKLKGVELNAFPVCDYGMPYAYAPCLCAHPDWLAANPDAAKAFLVGLGHGEGFPDVARHVIQRILVTRCLNQMASYDMASYNCWALFPGCHRRGVQAGWGRPQGGR